MKFLKKDELIRYYDEMYSQCCLEKLEILEKHQKDLDDKDKVIEEWRERFKPELKRYQQNLEKFMNLEEISNWCQSVEKQGWFNLAVNNIKKVKELEAKQLCKEDFEQIGGVLYKHEFIPTYKLKDNSKYNKLPSKEEK